VGAPCGPAFEFTTSNRPAGFDVMLMQRIAEQIGREWQLIAIRAPTSTASLPVLDAGIYDCIASGTTITPGRERIADFCATLCNFRPIARRRSEPPSKRAWDRRSQGLVIGVQQGNTSQPVAANSLTSIVPRRQGIAL